MAIDQPREVTIKEIRRLWQEGIESGPGSFESIEALIAGAKRQYAARNPK